MRRGDFIHQTASVGSTVDCCLVQIASPEFLPELCDLNTHTHTRMPTQASGGTYITSTQMGRRGGTGRGVPGKKGGDESKLNKGGAQIEIVCQPFLCHGFRLT